MTWEKLAVLFLFYTLMEQTLIFTVTAALGRQRTVKHCFDFCRYCGIFLAKSRWFAPPASFLLVAPFLLLVEFLARRRRRPTRRRFFSVFRFKEVLSSFLVSLLDGSTNSIG